MGATGYLCCFLFQHCLNNLRLERERERERLWKSYDNHMSITWLTSFTSLWSPWPRQPFCPPPKVSSIPLSIIEKMDTTSYEKLKYHNTSWLIFGVLAYHLDKLWTCRHRQPSWSTCCSGRQLIPAQIPGAPSSFPQHSWLSCEWWLLPWSQKTAAKSISKLRTPRWEIYQEAYMYIIHYV